MALSKTQIDRLGERLKSGSHTDEDLRLLDEYRRSFGEAYDTVMQTIRRQGVSPTGRRAKSTLSIVEKLRRESLRLSQMQDIAGCRVVVANVQEQDLQVWKLSFDFPGRIHPIIDRRNNPSHGYRAVHVIVSINDRLIEIQVRTQLQHLWAELSEKLSDVIDPAIKYGGGTDAFQRILVSKSEYIAEYERVQRQYLEALQKKRREDGENERVSDELWRKIQVSGDAEELVEIQRAWEESLHDIEHSVARLRESMEQSLLEAKKLLTGMIDHIEQITRGEL